MTNKQPIGATATIQWRDDGQIVEGYYFSFGTYDEDHEDADHGIDSNGVPDDQIFFYCDDEHELKSYMTAGKEDFIVLNYELEYNHADI